MTIAEMIALADAKAVITKEVSKAILQAQAFVSTPERVLITARSNCQDKTCPPSVECPACPYRPRRNYLKDRWEDRERSTYIYPTIFQVDFLGSDYTFLGEGHFGMVFKHEPTGYALKVTGFNEGGLDSYPAYARFCIANALKADPLKHLPEILHLQEFAHETAPAYFVILPEYTSADTTYPERRELQNIMNGKTSTSGSIPERYRDSIIATCEALAELAEYACVDLGGNNIMQDQYGLPVITDPFSFGTGTREYSSQSYGSSSCSASNTKESLTC